MKLQQIKIKKSTAKMQVQNITHKLQGVKTVGYISIISKRKVQVETVSKKVAKGFRVYCTQVRIFKTKTGRKLANLAILNTAQKVTKKLYEGVSKMFNTTFAQVAIFESNILKAKKALKDAKKQMLNTIEYFNLHVNLCKSYLHLRTFKMTLPKQILNLLF